MEKKVWETVSKPKQLDQFSFVHLAHTHTHVDETTKWEL